MGTEKKNKKYKKRKLDTLYRAKKLPTQAPHRYHAKKHATSGTTTPKSTFLINIIQFRHLISQIYSLAQSREKQRGVRLRNPEYHAPPSRPH